MEKKRCGICGGLFEPTNGRQKYCSRNCRVEARIESMNQYSRHSARREEKGECNCPVCKRSFVRKSNAQKCCSSECAKKYAALHRKKKTYRPFPEELKDAWCKRNDCFWHNDTKNGQFISCMYCYYTGHARKPKGGTWKECKEYITAEDAKANGLKKEITSNYDNVVLRTFDDENQFNVQEYVRLHYFGESWDDAEV